MQHANLKDEEIATALSSFSVRCGTLEAGSDPSADFTPNRTEPPEGAVRDRVAEALEGGRLFSDGSTYPTSKEKEQAALQKAGETLL